MELSFLLPLAVTLCLAATSVEAAGNYWWMDEPDVFSGGGGGGGRRQHQPQQSYPQHDNSNLASVQTECPAGTKCVSEHFCDENAVMVNYRVSLTPAQKSQRGELIVRYVAENLKKTDFLRRKLCHFSPA